MEHLNDFTVHPVVDPLCDVMNDVLTLSRLLQPCGMGEMAIWGLVMAVFIGFLGMSVQYGKLIHLRLLGVTELKQVYFMMGALVGVVKHVHGRLV